METVDQQFILTRTAPALPDAYDPVLGYGPTPKAPAMGADHPRLPSPPPAGLKPIADQFRKVSPFGSPKRGRVLGPNEAKRRRRRVVQVDPSHGGTDARVPRRGRWGDRFSAPASRVHGRPGIAGVRPAAGRASRGPANGFLGAFAGCSATAAATAAAASRTHRRRACLMRLMPQSSIPRTLGACVALDRKTLTAATGDQAGSNHSIPVPLSTYVGVVPRSGSRDGCPVGSSRHRAPVQGLACIAAKAFAVK